MRRMTSEDYEGEVDYQLHLFATLDMQALFDQQLREIKAHLEQHGADARILGVLHGQGEWDEICPLELRKGAITSTRFPQRFAQCETAEHVWVVPFLGDPVLWSLKPDPLLSNFPEGEIHRWNFITSVLSADTGAAEAEFQRRLATVEYLLDLQRQQIDTFVADLPEAVAKLLAEVPAVPRLAPRSFH